MGAYFAKLIRSEFLYLSGNVLTADGSRLYLNGNPIANLSDLTGFASGEYYPNSNPSGFEPSVSYTHTLNSGLESYYIPYPVTLAGTPKSISCDFSNSIDNSLYTYAISGVGLSGFYINFSDNLQASGYQLLISINK